MVHFESEHCEFSWSWPLIYWPWNDLAIHTLNEELMYGITTFCDLPFECYKPSRTNWRTDRMQCVVLIDRMYNTENDDDDDDDAEEKILLKQT